MPKKWTAPKGVSVVYKAKGFRKRPKKGDAAARSKDRDDNSNEGDED